MEGEVGLVCWPCFFKSKKQGKIKSWLNKTVILKLGRRFLYHAEVYAKQLPCAYTFSICEILGLCHFCRLWGVKSINDSEVRRVPSFWVRKGRSLGSLSASERSSAGCGVCWRHSSPGTPRHKDRSIGARTQGLYCELLNYLQMSSWHMAARWFGVFFLVTQGAKPSLRPLLWVWGFWGKEITGDHGAPWRVRDPQGWLPDSCCLITDESICRLNFI